jgi:hypothetical protein
MIGLQHLPSQTDGGGEMTAENPQGNFKRIADTIVQEVKAKENIQERALNATEEQKNGEETQIKVAHNEQKVVDQMTKDVVAAQTKGKTFLLQYESYDSVKVL